MNNKFFNQYLPATLYCAYALLAIQNFAKLDLQLENQSSEIQLNYWLTIIHYLLTFAFTGLVAFMLLFRNSPISEATLLKKIIAFIGTFIIWVLAYQPITTQDWRILAIGNFLSIVGASFSIYALTSLRWSFGIAPEARGLVTTGAYRFVRHPIYLGEFVLFLGILLPLISPVSLLIFLAFCYFQLKRAVLEEEVLKREYSKYANYQSKTPMIFPWAKISLTRSVEP